MTNIIGDIAGEYKTLCALIRAMPDGEIISVGDMIDRGPESKAVLDYFITTPNTQAILGNHEHMMLDHFNGKCFYQPFTWLQNSGDRTIQSFDPTETQRHPVPQKYLDWISNLPKYIIKDDIFISHSFLKNINDIDPIKYACEFGNSINNKGETTIIWNRAQPIRQKFKLQICGHNSQFGLRKWQDNQGVYAICLDDSHRKKLTGLHLESMTIYQQAYIR